MSPTDVILDRMRSLIPAVSDRPGDDPIFALNAIALERARAGESIVNATLGALMNDDGQLAIMPAVFEAYAKVDRRLASAYAPIAGDERFLGAVVDDVLAGSPMADQAAAVATAGATGALHHAIVNFLEPGQALYTTSYFWGPYGIIATHTGRRVETFEMFDDRGRFDVEAFERGLEQLLREQGRALVVLNFPCHNPTGYSLDDEEWTGIADALLRLGRTAPVTLLIDIAYDKYGAPGKRRWVNPVASIVGTCTVLVAWTASKSFAQYGSRVGALIGISADDEERDRIQAALAFACRGTWSNCNHLGILGITELLLDPVLKASADAQREKLKTLLGERVTVFNREAERLGLPTPRYEGGFFVAVFTPNAETTAAAAREQGVFVVPMNGAVRVALCSTPKADVPRLVQALAHGVEAARA